jgi:hypothetical protein
VSEYTFDVHFMSADFRHQDLDVESLSEWSVDIATDSPVAPGSPAKRDDMAETMGRLELTSTQTLGTVGNIMEEVRQMDKRLKDVEMVTSDSGRVIQDIKQSSGELLDRVSPT